ncbi:hypothetical protein [Photobacterium aquae]|nr:hypothetical protein [Photobacterium aquae]
MEQPIPEFYLPLKDHDVFIRYYTYQCQAGKQLPIWVYDKYILPYIR